MENELKRYRVGVVYTATHWVEVQAKNAEEAEEKGMRAASATLCHQCSGELDLEDPDSVCCVEEIEPKSTSS